MTDLTDFAYHLGDAKDVFRFHVGQDGSFFVTHRNCTLEGVVSNVIFLLLQPANEGFNVKRAESRTVFPRQLWNLVHQWSSSLDNETYDAFMTSFRNATQDSMMTFRVHEKDIRHARIFRADGTSFISPVALLEGKWYAFSQDTDRCRFLEERGTFCRFACHVYRDVISFENLMSMQSSERLSFAEVCTVSISPEMGMVVDEGLVLEVNNSEIFHDVGAYGA